MSSYEVKVTLLGLFLISIFNGTCLSLLSSTVSYNEFAGQKLYKPTALRNQTRYTKTPFPLHDEIQESRFTKCDIG